ncbi:MAG: hypothetical protein U5K31_08375 [Balneolaceae bacterium]|nr:hypothetical protein [Balneolaceae bacterium]
MSAQAQFYPVEYRPPNQAWQELSTNHFRIVYPAGSDSAALATGRLLEAQYGEVRSLVGGELHNFPVVLRGYNDRSNGFVTSLHFRSEIDLAPAAGKTINPRSGSWLEAVVPHELVHALQYSNLGGFTLPSIVGFFAPDLGRSFHGAIPSGINEGIAVHHESTGVLPGGGRGGYAWFTGPYRALHGGEAAWSMGQMVQTSSYTRPYNRHYIGGGIFTSWLHQEFGEDITRRALDFYVRFPFLGYGWALRHTTGFWPSRLHNRFEEAWNDTLSSTPSSTGATAHTTPEILPGLTYRGISARQPQWANDSTLVFHLSSYNSRSGFYQYRLSSGDMTRLTTTGSVSDYHFDLSPDAKQLIFAVHRPSARYDNAFRADLALWEKDAGRHRFLSRNLGLFSPVFAENDIYALQNIDSSTRLVRFDPASGQPTPLLDIGNARVTDLAASPVGSDRLALIVNRRGVQGLWIVDTANLPGNLPKQPDIAFENGSVFDPEWHPSGKYLLFSSDRDGSLQLYEYRLDGASVRQLTSTRSNVFEGSYSPSGDRIAYVVQEGSEHLPALMERSSGTSYPTLPEDIWQAGPSVIERMTRPPAGSTADTTGWEEGDYKVGMEWLRPRLLLPYVEEVSNRDVYRIGISLHSSDLLQQQSYGLDLTQVQDRFWYDLTYRNSRFFPGFEASISSTPSYRDFRFVTQQDTVVRSMVREQRDFSLAFPFRWTLENNVFFSSLTLRPELSRSQIRYFELHHAGDAASDFANIPIGRLYAVLNYRLQQNSRDLQPNSGVQLYGQLEHYFSGDHTVISTLGEQFQLNFNRPTALRAGINTWVSPLRRFNQSLRLGIQLLTQTAPVFDTQSVVSQAFADPVLPLASNLVSLESRYTIPLFYPDNGGFLLPLYLENIYLAAFSDTVFDPSNGGLSQAQSVVGIELHTKFRLSNLSLDVGLGIGYEPSRDRFGLVFRF